MLKINKTYTGTTLKGRIINDDLVSSATATSTGVLGEIRITATHIYVCTATNTWRRTALTTW